MTGKALSTVCGIGRRNGLQKKSYYWTKTEDDYLLKNVSQGYQALAEHFGRTFDAVKNRHRKLFGKRK